MNKPHLKKMFLAISILASCSDGSNQLDPVGYPPRSKTKQGTNDFKHSQNTTVETFQATTVRPITFSGSAEELGIQHGSTLKTEISNVNNNWLKPIRNLIPFLVEAFISAKSSSLVQRLPADFLVELRALARASQISEGEKPVLLGNLTPDLMAMAQKPLGCSTFVVMPERSRTGGMIFGRNLDYAFSEYLRGQWRPIVYRKLGKHAILSLTIPGVIGVISGLNDRGVAMTINMSHTKDAYSTEGVGALAIFRKVLEDAETAEQARDLYSSFKRTIAINVTITDGKSAYVLEATPSRSKYRSSINGVLYAANHYVFQELGDSTKPDFRWPILQSKDSTKESLGLPDVRTIISQTGVENTNVLAFILDYAGKKLYYGSSKGKAIAGQLSVVDVSEFIR